MDMAKINPNTQKGKCIVVFSRIAEDVTTAWHANIGLVKKKKDVAPASAHSRVCPAGPRRNEELVPALLSSPMGLQCPLIHLV